MTERTPTRRGLMSALVASALALTALQCGAPQTPDGATPGSCAASAEALAASLSAAASHPAVGRAEATPEGFEGRLEALQGSRLAQAGRCAEAPDARAERCVVRALERVEALSAALSVAGEVAPREARWLLAGRLLSVEDALMCEPAERITLGAVTVVAPGRRRDASGVHLESGEAGASRLGVTARLVCERQVEPGRFEAIPRCDGELLREDDRFQVQLLTTAPARVYLMMYSGAGQFQMLYPEVGGGAAAQARRTLPEEGDWWVMDGHGGVLDSLLLVVATDPVSELEALLGADVPATAEGLLPPVAQRARGKMEPVVTRSLKIGEGGQRRLLRPVGAPEALPDLESLSSEGEGVVAVEFRIDHAR